MVTQEKSPAALAEAQARIFKIGELRPHALNAELYADGPDDNLIASVQEHGILTSLLVTEDGLIISGHRRWRAAQLAGLSEVCAIPLPDCDDDHLVRLLLEANAQRQKSLEQRLAEFEQYLHLEAREAKKRQGQRNDLRENSPGSSESRARDIAAARVGLSGGHAAKGLRIMKVLREQAAAGNEQQCEEMRRLLNEASIEAAFKKCRALGWFGTQTSQPADETGETQEAAPAQSPTPADSGLSTLLPEQEPCMPELTTNTASKSSTRPAMTLADGSSAVMPDSSWLKAEQLKKGFQQLTSYARPKHTPGAPVKSSRLTKIQRIYLGLIEQLDPLATRGEDDDELLPAALRALANTIEIAT